MYQCPNCAANLKFDIKLQKMHCEYCGTDADPYQVVEKHKVEEHVETVEEADSETMQVTIYTCSQCGGEIIGDENEAATFCSFCGASTIMNGRIDRALRPSKIIPFSQTKDDCARAYKKLVAKAFFAPDYVKDPQKIDGFRGIYMPYWVYDFAKNGKVSYKGKRVYQKGDYEYTEHYNVTTDVDVLYKGMEYDASSSFSDRLSNSIAPFDAKEPMDFTSAFMSGFYGDVMDVDAGTYSSDASKAVAYHVVDKIKGNQGGHKYTPDFDSLRNALTMTPVKSELAMLPVWFMSYRTKDEKGEDKVLYSVVNGQTGKCAADLPISLKKFLVGSVLLALPIFVLFNLFLTITPKTIMVIACIIAIICKCVARGMAKRILDINSGVSDKGIIAKNKPANGKGLRKKKAEADKERDQALKEILKGDYQNYAVLSWIAMALCVLIFIMHPVSDVYYYVAVIFTGIADCLVLVAISKLHNKMVSRPLPQFKRKGGDDRANISKDI